MVKSVLHHLAALDDSLEHAKVQDYAADALRSEQAHVRVAQYCLTQVERGPRVVKEHDDQDHLTEDADKDVHVELGALHPVRLISLHGRILPSNHLGLAL